MQMQLWEIDMTICDNCELRKDCKQYKQGTRPVLCFSRVEEK